MTTRISPHFTLAELTFSDTAVRLGIDNHTKDTSIHNRLADLADNILEPIRAHFGKPYRPNSAYRCYELEEVLCKSAIERFLRDNPGLETVDYLRKKQHPTGRAADIEIPGVRNIDLARWIERNIPQFDQLILEFYSPEDPAAGWVHISYNAYGNRNEILTIGKGGAVVGLPK